MALTLSDAEEMVTAAKLNGRFLMEGMWTRFFPAARAIKQAIASGAIGKVVSVSASLGFKSEPEFNPRLFLPEL